MIQGSARPNGYSIGGINNLYSDLASELYADSILQKQQAQQPSTTSQQDSINWLNAAGLGALAAGLGTLGVVALNRRGKATPPPKAQTPPPTGPTLDPRRPGPGPQPQTPAPTQTPAATPQRRSQPQTPTAAVTAPTAAATTPAQTATPASIDAVDQVLADYLNLQGLAQELGGSPRISVAGVTADGRLIPNVQGAVAPQEAMTQAAQMRQYKNNLASTADRLLADLRGTQDLRPQTVQVVDLNAPAANLDAMQSGLQQDLRRSQNNRLQQEQLPTQSPATAPSIQGPTDPATLTVANLQSLGLPDFEIEARMQAYASTGDKRLMSPDFNTQSVGDTEFARALGIVNAYMDENGNIIKGEFLNPAGDVTRSFKGSRTPSLEIKGDSTIDPVASELGTLEGSMQVVDQGAPTRGRGLSVAEDPQAYEELKSQNLIQQKRQSEQYKIAIDQFGNQWDTLYLSGPDTGIKAPRTELRPIDVDDLNIPTRIESDADGNLYPTKLFKDQLDPAVVEKVMAGEEVLVDVPFLVNKTRALMDAEAFGEQMPELVAKAEDYVSTGQALTDVYKATVGDLGEGKYVQQGLMEGAYFEPAEAGIMRNPDGSIMLKQVGSGEAKPRLAPSLQVTPSAGPGSQKGRLVGGTPERPVAEPVYRLEYEPYVTANGRKMMLPKAYGIDANGEPTVKMDATFERLDNVRPDGTPVYLIGETNPTNQDALTQPMRVSRLVNNQPIGQVQREGKYGLYKVPVYEAVDEIVQAPLQVQDAQGNPLSYTGQIKREDLAYLNDQAIRLLGSQKSDAMLDVTNLAKGNQQRGPILNDEQVTAIRQFIDYTAGDRDPANPVLQQANELGLPAVNTYSRIPALIQAELKDGEMTRLASKGKYERYGLDADGNPLRNQGIQLPVLDSPTANLFLRNVIGQPDNPPAIRRLVTIDSKTKTRYPVSQEQVEAAQAAGLLPTSLPVDVGRVLLNDAGEIISDTRRQISRPIKTRTTDRTLSRGVRGPKSLDITQSAKDNSGLPTGERMGYGDDDIVAISRYDAEAGPQAYYGNVELGSAQSPEQMRYRTSPAMRSAYTGGPNVAIKLTNQGPALADTRSLPRTLKPSAVDLDAQRQAIDPQSIGKTMEQLRQQASQAKAAVTLPDLLQARQALAKVANQQPVANAYANEGDISAMQADALYEQSVNRGITPRVIELAQALQGQAVQPMVSQAAGPVVQQRRIPGLQVADGGQQIQPRFRVTPEQAAYGAMQQQAAARARLFAETNVPSMGQLQLF